MPKSTEKALPIISTAIFVILALSSCRHYINNEQDERAYKLISSIKTSRDVDIQSDMSAELFDIFRLRRCEGISKENLDGIISLLDIDHDGVRYWSVRILGQIGPCAKYAIPELKRILPQADCWPARKTSAPDIRAILESLGEPRIPEADCTTSGEGY